MEVKAIFAELISLGCTEVDVAAMGVSQGTISAFGHFLKTRKIYGEKKEPGESDAKVVAAVETEGSSFSPALHGFASILGVC